MKEKKSILVVEDNPSIREPLCFLLEDEGYDVASAEDGEKALDSVRANRPDLIFLDIMMPRKNGLEVLTELKGAAETESIYIVMFSANGDSDELDKCMEVGANEFVRKPYSPIKLLEKIESIFNARSN